MNDPRLEVLNNILISLIESGSSVEQVKKSFESVKSMFKFTNEEIYEFYIQECIKERKVYSVKEFMNHATNLINQKEVTDEQNELITNWLLKLLET